MMIRYNLTAMNFLGGITMTGPISSGMTSSPTTLFAASPVTKMTTSVSGGGVTVVPSHQHQPFFPHPHTVQLTIPSVTKTVYEAPMPSSNGSGVTVNLTTSHDDDDVDGSRDVYEDDVPLAASEEIVQSPRVEVKPILDEPETKRPRLEN